MPQPSSVSLMTTSDSSTDLWLVKWRKTMLTMTARTHAILYSVLSTRIADTLLPVVWATRVTAMVRSRPQKPCRVGAGYGCSVLHLVIRTCWKRVSLVIPLKHVPQQSIGSTVTAVISTSLSISTLTAATSLCRAWDGGHGSRETPYGCTLYSGYLSRRYCRTTSLRTLILRDMTTPRCTGTRRSATMRLHPVG